jgi:hypothetical protein
MERRTFAIALAMVVACHSEREPEPWPLSSAVAPPVDGQVPPPVELPPPPSASASASAAPTAPGRPPPVVAPFDHGYLERQPGICWMASAPPEPCNIHGECKSPPLWAHVTCPPTLARSDKAHHVPPKNLPVSPKGGYLEKVTATNRCYHAAKRPSCSPGTIKCNIASTEVRCP